MIEQNINIRAIIENYEAFIIDLWGVIHDGVVAYPGVDECLSQMKQAGKTIIFLSNAPRRAARAIEGLRKVGVPDGLYDHIITSGEVTYEYLKASDHGLGKKHYMIGPERDAGLLDGLDYVRVKTPAEAEFVIVTGFEEDSSTLEEKIPQLQECLKHNLLMICANPDYVVVRQTGARALCAGAMAQQYEKMGGKVMQFGKPYRDVYEKCMSMIDDISIKKVAAIGDNLDTDIRGANNFGVDSYLIAGGILGEELGIKHGQMPDLERLEAVCKKAGNLPVGVLPAFVW